MKDTPDTHAQLVAAGYLRRGQDVATVARATGLGVTDGAAIVERLRRADHVGLVAGAVR